MSENNINDNQKFFEFAEKINDETLELMRLYDSGMPSITKKELLEKIKLRIDILSPIKELQLKEQQIAAAQQLTQGDFMKNFNLKDLIGALKGNS
jgi:hypothetical protein